MIHLDTSFLVDLIRERRSGARGPASALFARIRNEELAISLYVACELLAGAEGARDARRERGRMKTLVEQLRITRPTDSLGFAERYGRLLVQLRRGGEAIAAMDLLIATSALDADAALVTRNVRHFSRVPGLELAEY